jgi:hypothetical protein
MHVGLKEKCLFFLLNFNQNREVSTNFVDNQNMKFQENLYDGSLAVPFRQTYGRTDGHDEDNTQ